MNVRHSITMAVFKVVAVTHNKYPWWDLDVTGELACLVYNSPSNQQASSGVKTKVVGDLMTALNTPTETSCKTNLGSPGSLILITFHYIFWLHFITFLVTLTLITEWAKFVVIFTKLTGCSFEAGLTQACPITIDSIQTLLRTHKVVLVLIC